MKVLLAGLAAAGVAATGVGVVALVVTGGEQANLWVDADGGACVDNTAPTGYSDADACTFTAAVAACDNGDIVHVRTNIVYPGQRLLATNGRTAVCTIRPEPGTGPIRVSGDMTIDGADWLRIENVQCGDPASHTNEAELFVKNGANDNTFDGWDCASFDVFTSSRTTISNGDWGPCGSSSTRKCVPRVALDSSNSGALLEGNRFHDISCGNGSAAACGSFHTDGLAVFGGSNITVKRNRFYRNDIVNIRFQNCCGNTPIQNLTVESNWFGPVCNSGDYAPCSGGGRPGGFDVDSPIPGLRVAFNSFSGGISAQSTMGTTVSQARMVGNAFQNAACAGNTVYERNVFVPFSEFTGQNACGPTDVKASAFGYVQNTLAEIDYHLTVGSVLHDKVPSSVTGGCASPDIDGQPRSTTLCDAGSDEAGDTPPQTTTAATTTTTAPPPPNVVRVAFEQRFLPNLRDASLYTKWRSQNPGEAGRLDGYLADPKTPPPTMVTAFGRAVVAVVEMYGAS